MSLTSLSTLMTSTSFSSYHFSLEFPCLLEEVVVVALLTQAAQKEQTRPTTFQKSCCEELIAAGCRWKIINMRSTLFIFIFSPSSSSSVLTVVYRHFKLKNHYHSFRVLHVHRKTIELVTQRSSLVKGRLQSSVMWSLPTQWNPFVGRK